MFLESTNHSSTAGQRIRPKPPNTGRGAARGPVAAALSGTMFAAALASLGLAPAGAAVAGMGPVDPANGFPTWYSDGTVKLEFCVSGPDCLSQPPDPNAPVSYPDNFPDEAFWYVAEASGGNLGLYEAALEGAHANEAVIDGDQMGFARLRFRIDNLVPDASYTVTHPYGVNVFTAEADPQDPGLGQVNVTIDEGVCAPTPAQPCDWAGVGAAFLGDFANGATAAFVKQVNATAGNLGNLNAPGPVTGAPSGTNAVVITGPDAGGPGVDTLTVSDFTVQGKISAAADGAPSTPDLAAASDTGRSSTDNVTNDATPTFNGTVPVGVTAVSLRIDGGAPFTASVTGGSYTRTLGSPLAPGTHTVQALSGALTSGTLTFTVDTTAPAVTIVPPFPSSPTADRTPTFSFTVNEAGAAFECRLLPNNATWDPTCLSPKTFDAQVNGAYSFEVRATDAAGNLGAVANRSVVIGTGGVTGGMHDFSGDGRADVLARDSSGRLWLYRGNGTGGFQPRTLVGNGWNIMTSITGTGDFSGDARADILARDTSGRLWLYRGNGTGGFQPRTLVGNGWNIMTSITGTGDFSGDARADILARDTSGRLWLYRGNGTGGFQPRTFIGNGWNIMTSITGTGDFSGDARADILARDTSGRLWLYRGNGTGGFQPRTFIGNGWNIMTSITGTGDFSGDARADVLARDTSGRLWLYRGNGTGGFQPRTLVGNGWNIMNAIV
ncbi:hypothetical protein BIU82_09815 [Arthrobacter sp. SW1]|uniref:FG-GAP-like repeat-containing protein n=1 Tax=Arthrobacter sp. SW1 TaxID=1920889 RepID=UPI000877E00B|nr:FG-GAP-like repeat-containing protein [Arthrobacter sp. SW1]OFI37354.1 hypothetical protein BIU82_09815 [Arthrobacter sp. SW1]